MNMIQKDKAVITARMQIAAFEETQGANYIGSDLYKYIQKNKRGFKAVRLAGFLTGTGRI